MLDIPYHAIDRQADTLGGRISFARDVLDLSTEDAARILGVEVRTWANWEKDRAEPRANRLSMLAGVLQVSLPWLLTGQGHGPDWEEPSPVEAQ